MIDRPGRPIASPGAVLVLILLSWCSDAAARNPELDVSQYAHTAWRIRDGFTNGAINAIVQAPDGYLWLGTDSGLLRFDGVKNVPWHPPDGQRLPSNNVQSLFVARDGTLWIGTEAGLASWKDGKITTYQELTTGVVSNLVEDREGSIWMTRFVGTWMLCQVQNSHARCYGEDGG